MAEVCGALFRDLGRLVERIGAAIVREVPDFRDSPAITPGDLTEAARRTAVIMLRSLAERRSPQDDELQVWSCLGRRAPSIGLSLRSLMDATHVGYRELWGAFTEHARRPRPSAVPLFLAAGEELWKLALEVTSVMAEEYQREAARLEAAETRTAAQFVHAIEEDPRSPRCAALARALGFRAEGRFRAVALSLPGAPPGWTASGLMSALHEEGVSATYVEQGTTALVLAQPADPDGFEAVLSRAVSPPAGVGLEHEGLEGAHLSLVEARRALQVGIAKRSVCRVEQEWLAAAVRGLGATLGHVLAPGVAAASRFPHLAEAVRAFAGSGFSVAAAARCLRLSQTSTRYRLCRWRALTGWDPWSFDGLARSLVACDLAEAQG